MGELEVYFGPAVAMAEKIAKYVHEHLLRHAQAVIRTLQADEHQRGCLMEERVLKGELAYESGNDISTAKYAKYAKSKEGSWARILGSYKLCCFFWFFVRLFGVFRGLRFG